MTSFGTITYYDVASGTGTIAPDSGGRMLTFTRTDIVWGEEPSVDERFGFNVRETEGGERTAFNLQFQQSEALRRLERLGAEQG